MSDVITVQQVALDLLQFIGVTGFSDLDNANALNRPGLDTLDTEKALAAINAALQTIQRHGPLSMKEGEKAAYLNNPTYVNVNVNALQAQSVEFVDTPPTWIHGCSILIEGDSDLNRVSDVTGNDVSLLRGYRGSTANNIQATIYADCATLPDDVGSVLEPVIVSPNMRLRRAASLDQFLAVTEHWSYQNTVGVGYGTSKPMGNPSLYYTEKRVIDAALYLRLNPMPGAATNVTYRCKILPERFGVEALALDGGPDPGLYFTTIPEDMVESVLMPIARGKFLSHPALKNYETRQTIQQEYREAMLRLENGSVFETSVGTTRACYI